MQIVQTLLQPRDLFGNPRPDIVNKSRIFGDLYEIVRPDETTFRMFPAQQRFSRNHLVRACAGYGLVIENEFVFLKRAFQVLLEGQVFIPQTAHAIPEADAFSR